MSKAKNWIYTLNNPTAPLDIPDAVYHVYGEEIAPTTGTPHYQGYVSFSTQKRLTQLQKICPRSCWLVMKGTPLQASDYCKKDGKFIEIGELPASQSAKGGAANKRKYEEAFAAAKIGDMENIPVDLRIKHYRTFKQIKVDYMPAIPSLDDTCGIWYYGESGVGKSKRARDEFPDAYLKPCNNGGMVIKVKKLLSLMISTPLMLA